MAKKRKGKKKSRPRNKKTGKFLTRRQIAARRLARKGKTSKRRKPTRGRKAKPVAKKKKRRRRRRSGGGGGLSNKQKQEVCMASAALGYIEENTGYTENLPMYKVPPGGVVAKPAKRHLVYGLVGHFASRSFGAGSGVGKWLDRGSTALLIVGSWEAGQSKFSLEGIGGNDDAYDEVEAEVSGEIDDEG